MKRKVLFLLISTMLSTALQAQEPALKIIDKATTQAKAENKNVFLMFHASWCCWCKKMDKQLEGEACKDYFNANYLIEHLTVQESPKNKNLENPGGMAIMQQYKGEKAGLPFWVILDKDGKLIGDSLNARGENLGCPQSPEEIDTFLAILKETSALTNDELAVIAKTFSEK